MKIVFIPIIGFMLLAAVSCNSKSEQSSQVNDNSNEKTDDQPKASGTSPNIPPGMESLIGEWRLVKWISDKNGNNKIDPEEEKEGKAEMPDYLKLNLDGTCEYTDVKIPARYVIETEDDGQKKLAMYDPTGPEIGITRYIMSVSDKELVLYRVKDSFEVFRRL